ncbi:hypothetical protein [Paraoerskovia sediminicola]|nr:hypothetical protein [Paraoerskovia sediminicola]
MADLTLSTTDIGSLRDILDLADSRSTAPSPAVVEELLRCIERLFDADDAAFHAMDARDFSYQHVQEVVGDEAVVLDAAGLAAWGADDDPGLQVLRDHWWVSSCSLIERTGAPVATSLRSWVSERRWAEHPVHKECLPYVDELILGYPWEVPDRYGSSSVARPVRRSAIAT